jgi:hypothetical protein
VSLTRKNKNIIININAGVGLARPPPQIFFRQSLPWHLMVTLHSLVFPYHVGRRFSDDLLAAPPSSHWASVLVVVSLYLFVLDAVSGHLRLWGCCYRMQSYLVRYAGCLFRCSNFIGVFFSLYSVDQPSVIFSSSAYLVS